MNNIIRFEEQMQMAKAFKESGLFPDLKSEAQAIVKIQAGKELGIEPFASIQGVNIVLGKPVMSANLQAGLIKKSGKYNYKMIEHNEQVCKLEFYEKWGDTWQVLGSSEFTIKEAQQAGLAHKDNWKKHAKNMLFARAMSNGAKWYCADVFITGTYNESDEFESAPVVQVDNTGLDAIKAKVQAQNTVIEATIAKPVVEAIEPIVEPVVDKFKIEDGDDFQTVLDGFNNVITIKGLLEQREFIKSYLDLTAEQLETVEKRFSERQKEIRNAIKAKVQEQSKPVIIKAELVEPKPVLSDEEMKDWEMLLANAVDMEALNKLRDIIKNELKTSDEQFSTLKKLFLKRQKELKNG